MELLTRKPNRLKNYDYSLEGYYYITICSKDRENIFGDYVKDDVVAVLASAHDHIKLSIVGQIINTQLQDIQNQFENVELDEYIIMPNHLHGIIIIKKRVEASAPPTISQIIRSLKSKCTNEYLQYINEKNLNISGKIWQRSFYDHIIRDEKSLNKIRNYIINNPANWLEDEENINK
jgi:REP element-mobilizing transposase RayT